MRPEDIRDRLSRHVLVDGFHVIADLARSQGSWLVDARTGERYLDLYTFFASAPLGSNPVGLATDEEFVGRLGRVAANKPANPDVYTAEYADFVETFARVLGDPSLPHLFFVEGGALAVENALKCAFDWKSRHNEMRGRSPALGARAMHLTHAFHGRSGYTLSLTNTDPVKTDRFPVFDWPRIDAPAIRFPQAEHWAQLLADERESLRQVAAAFDQYPHDIACFIAEPIQGEGGDNHFRSEWLQAVQALCRRHDALFVLDEVQTGVGLTGSAWAYQQLDLEPDIVAFAKKTQVGGIMAGRRVDDVDDNVFRVSGRINSTWGGGLVDMVRSQRLLEIIERDALFGNARRVGAWFLQQLEALSGEYPTRLSNVRGRGLMCAVDLADPDQRDRTLQTLREEEHVLALPCGARSIRFRPALDVTTEELEFGVTALRHCLGRRVDQVA